MADLVIPQSSLADLSYLRQMSPIIAQFLVRSYPHNQPAGE